MRSSHTTLSCFPAVGTTMGIVSHLNKMLVENLTAGEGCSDVCTLCELL